ncbi:PA3496 family putative envelope integrity protein [Thalassotalea sp. PS06]|uniref:PA3496 family putative envelope integrity protein n=1 Tax=Thalassotalea sp. PS06 TaxID=2594005 RepID=UPI0011647848|nr:hypothetical protein [Thalassotalea sp. PS06]QDP02248.1 hypothetical protein FNC98_13400 [Thalassotalea sp. PS06]
MTGNDMIDDDFEENMDDGVDAEETDTDMPKDDEANAKTRKRIDELLEKKRLKELLDEDEWEI